MVQGLNPGSVKRFFSFPKPCRPAVGSSQLTINRYGISFPRVKRPGLEVDYLPPTGAEVRNEWICTSAALICLNGVDWDNFTVYLFKSVDGIQRNKCFLFSIAFLG
jgi:hypothetical protein